MIEDRQTAILGTVRETKTIIRLIKRLSFILYTKNLDRARRTEAATIRVDREKRNARKRVLAESDDLPPQMFDALLTFHPASIHPFRARVAGGQDSAG
jgi:hypothetical protein